jgi:acyl-CoA thioester hydrolase
MMESIDPHIFSLRIRDTDCDPYGHARTASYLTFIHEADAGTHLAAEPNWTARRWYLEFFLPLRPGDQADVKSWVSSSDPHSQVRVYEIRKTGSSDLSARGTVEWIRQDGSTIVLSPTLPASGVSPDGGSPSTASETIQFPDAPPPPPGVFTQSRRVAWCELGLDDKLTPTACLEYLVECGIQAGYAYGWSFEVSQGYGLAFVARKQWLETLELPGLGVQITIDTWLSDMKRSTLTRHYVVRRVSDGTLVALGRTLWVTVDLNTGAPTRVPTKFIEDFRPHIAGI